MLIEAVDRDAARQDMEKRLAETERLLDAAKSTKEEQTRTIEFLIPLASAVPSFKRILDSTVEELEFYDKKIPIWARIGRI